jgi:hypothetical protein
MKNAASELGRESKDTISLSRLLSEFSIDVKNEAVPIEAQRLRPPALQFGDRQIEANTFSGSWNLNRKKFMVYVGYDLLVLYLLLVIVLNLSLVFRAAPFMSYVVLDLGHGGPMMQASQFMSELFKTMHDHGFVFENECDKFIHDLVVKGRGDDRPEQVRAP